MSLATKTLPHVPQPMKQNTPSCPLVLDDEAKIYLWKLIHTWLRHEKLQAKWASVLNDLLLHILRSCTSSETLSTETARTCIQLFETGSPSQSKYLPGVLEGIQLQTLTDLPLPLAYGGTVRLYGAPLSLQPKLTDIIAISLYTLYSLQLEVGLLQDHRITLTTQLSQSELVQDIPPTTTNDTTITGAIWKHGLLGWVLGRRSDKIVDEKEVHSEKVAPKRRLSLLALKTTNKKPADNKLGQPSPPRQPDLSDPHYYQHMRLGLERACVSTSPTCTFISPPIIIVLENEEENLNTMKMIISNGLQQDDKKQRSSDQPLRNKLTSLARRSSSILSLGPTDQRKSAPDITLILPQSITAYNMLRIPKHVLNTTNKVGMDYLYLDPASIEAFIHHQHMVINYTSYPIGCPDRPCLGPILCTIQYFRFDDQSPYSDQTLESTLNRWLDECTHACMDRLNQQTRACNDWMESLARHAESQDRISVGSEQGNETSTQLERRSTTKMPLHGCKQPLQDHVLCFSHGSSRISVYFISTTDLHTTMVNDTLDSLNCWLACTLCDARTQPHPISLATRHFSFAKYLELCLYSTRFTTPHDNLCHHAKTNPTTIARCFGRLHDSQAIDPSGRTTTTTEIRFIKEDIDVYRLRGSPLQVVQPSATTTSSSSLRPRISKSTMEKWIIRESRAIEDLFKHLQRHLVALQNGPIDKDRTNRLNADHQNLLQSLKNASTGEKDGNLNDFRRFFAMAACTIVDDINTWQLERWPDTNPFTWKARPDYMNTDINDTIHCFPDSAVMVRELEPTSIIAYTLSSNDYVDELECESTNRSKGVSSAIPSSKKKASSPPPPPPPPLSTQSSSGNSNDSEPADVIDGYLSTVERKYVSPSTGSATETASFRTMIMETVRNNVTDHRLSLMKQRLARSAPLSLSTRKIQRQQTTERDLSPTSAGAAKDIKESTVYHNPPSESSSWFEDSSASPGDQSPALSPHIKHRFVHGNVEFICTVYYANEFESLRKSCGVDQLIIESLCRCQNWNTTGGKSKSQFYKTLDDRLVVKEMVNAWNITEKDAFLRFAPKYFEYVRDSDKSPTLLAKIFGFYSIQMQSTDEKKQALNIDVLVMEQLFYGKSISKTFDFKGIPDRQVDEEHRGQDGCTLWDADWHDDYRMGHVTHEQSRQWIYRAIERDTQFLAANNIMDYSLLVGVDKSRKELSIGLVDYIGTYTWYKKIESKSKSTLHRNRHVTVLPPDQYKARFCQQVYDYFIPVPGKFDKIALDQTNSSAWMK